MTAADENRASDGISNEPVPPAIGAVDDVPSLTSQVQRVLRDRMGVAIPDGPVTTRGVLALVGGVRGVLETVLPGVVFLVVFTVLFSLAGQPPQTAMLPALGASLALALGFTLARVIARQRPGQAVIGFLGVAVSAVLAFLTKDARDNYLLGLLTNAGYALALLTSVLVRWPIVGIVVGLLDQHGSAWRRDRRQFLVAQWLTVAWCGLFVARLAVQLPLYLTNNAVGLGITRLAMGLPLYAILMVGTWMVANAVFRQRPSTGAAPATNG